MAEESDPKLVEWTERLSEGETSAAAARDSLFDAVCSALGATPAELAAAASWAPRRPDAPFLLPPPGDTSTLRSAHSHPRSRAALRAPGARLRR